VRVRDWTEVDHYAVLGVAPTATRDEIAAAYRAQARVLHPDTGATDPDAEARFVRVAAAHRVLTGSQRDEYDRARRRGQVAVGAGSGAPPRPAAPAPWRLSRRGARAALAAGIALVVASVGVAIGLIALHAHEAHLRAAGVPVRALVVDRGGVPLLEFVADGAVVDAPLPDARSGETRVGDRVEVRYDRAHPTRVVAAAGTTARDITLWIVAVKLLVVGIVLTVVGARRLRRDP